MIQSVVLIGIQHLPSSDQAKPRWVKLVQPDYTTNVADPTATKATAENYTEQLKELKTAIKSVKDASIRVLGNVNERTKELDKNKIC